jgi:S-adenosylmethionine:diacylglycerol 3-amino-3-carboxypropyl transferase
VKLKQKLGELIDELRRWDNKIDRQEAILRDLKKQRRAVEDKVLDRFDKDKIQNASGKLGRARILKGQHPKLKDRKKFIKYVVQNRAWDLFTNAIGKKAYFDRLEEGEQVPGVEIFTSFKISVSKIKRG